ncbi:MAG: helix-turn-helix transcriptional regulator [Halanaeroarchaeum sp.]
MKRRTLDLAVGGLVATVVVLVIGWTWQAWRTPTTTVDGMMGGMMTTSMMTTSPTPIWPLLLTLLVVGVIVVGYLAIRENVGTPGRQRSSPTGGRFDESREERRSAAESNPSQRAHSKGEGSSSVTEGDEEHTGVETETGDSGQAGPTRAQRSLLDVLPEDERRILEPVIDSPGVTQIELRDRSDFSKSKVSQTVSDLEKRGLLYRERQGRTYRVYPAEDLKE